MPFYFMLAGQLPFTPHPYFHPTFFSGVVPLIVSEFGTYNCETDLFSLIHPYHFEAKCNETLNNLFKISI
jgi:hypothetical protein